MSNGEHEAKEELLTEVRRETELKMKCERGG